MKKTYLILFVLVLLQPVSAQKIVWESDYLLPEQLILSFCQVVKDKDNNYVSIFRDVYDDITTVNFIKFSPDGKLIKYDSIKKNFSISADCFYETGNGYRLFCGVNQNPMTMYLGRLPYVIDFDFNWEIINESCPYEIYNNDMTPENTYRLRNERGNVINIGNSFYLAFEMDLTKKNDSVYEHKGHIIISKYREDGKILWRYGYDTSSAMRISYLRDIKKTFSNDIATISDNYKYGSGRSDIDITIMETDTNGNLLKKFVYEKDSLEKESDCIAPLPDGGYIVKAHYYGSFNEFYWKIDSDGNIIKKAIIPHHQNSYFTFLTDKMVLAPDGGVILMGRHTFYDLPKLANDSLRFYLVKLNSELELEWEYEWHECIYHDESTIRDLMFLDNNNIIVTGCKDRYKFYIAQIHIGKTDVKENLSGRQAVLAVRPQPFRDVCEITVTDAAGQYLEVSLYDINGHKIMNLCSETALTDKKSFIVNGLGLAPGVYFVEAKAGGHVLSEKIIKI